MTASATDFTKTLKSWLKQQRPKTVGELLTVLGDKSFALLFLVLMIIPATPLPTGGITHIFEIIVALVALQLIIGRSVIWLPRSLAKRQLGKQMQQKALPFLLRRLDQAEKFSRPRFSNILQQRWFKSQLGLFVLLFTAGAFLSPPFTGLDTLPSLGVVFISIGIILEDIAIVVVGYVVGLAGIALSITLGAGFFTAITHLFH